MQHHRWFLLFQEETGSPLAAESSLFVPLALVFFPVLSGKKSLLGNHTVRPYVGAVNRVALYLVSKAINGRDSGLRY
jgi:hypothetical protein